MKGKYEKGLKKGSKGSKTEEKQNFPKGNKISTPYGHGNENKNNCEKKIRILQNQVHQVNQYSILNQIK